MPSERNMYLGWLQVESTNSSRFWPVSKDKCPALPYLQYLYVHMPLRKPKKDQKVTKITKKFQRYSHKIPEINKKSPSRIFYWKIILWQHTLSLPNWFTRITKLKPILNLPLPQLDRTTNHINLPKFPKAITQFPKNTSIRSGILFLGKKDHTDLSSSTFGQQIVKRTRTKSVYNKTRENRVSERIYIYIYLEKEGKV